MVWLTIIIVGQRQLQKWLYKNQTLLSHFSDCQFIPNDFSSIFIITSFLEEKKLNFRMKYKLIQLCIR